MQAARSPLRLSSGSSERPEEQSLAARFPRCSIKVCSPELEEAGPRLPFAYVSSDPLLYF